MFCTKCGIVIMDDSVFCPKCGSNMGEEIAKIRENVQGSLNYEEQSRTEKNIDMETDFSGAIASALDTAKKKADFPRIMTLLVGMFTKPYDTVKNVMEQGDVVPPVLIGIVTLLLSLIVSFFVDSDSTALEILMDLFLIITWGVYALFVYLFARNYSPEMKYRNVFAAVSVTKIVPFAVGFLCVIFEALDITTLVIAFGILYLIAGLLLDILVAAAAVEADTNTKCRIIAIIIMIVVFVISILCGILVNEIKDAVSSSISSFFRGLL